MNSLPKALAFMFLCAGGVLSQGASETARVKQVVGRVETRSAQAAAWKPVRVGMLVKTGCDVRTFVESSAELEFSTGSVIRLGENSLVTISKSLLDKETATSTTAVSVGTGRVWANVKKLANVKSSFEFETPTAVASIRGTTLGLSVGQRGTVIDVFKGTVMVRARGSDREASVIGGVRAVVRPGTQQVQVVTFEESARDTGSGLPPVLDAFSDDTSSARDSGAAPSGQGMGGGDSAAAGQGSGGRADSAALHNPEGEADAGLRASSAPPLFLTVVAPRNGELITEPMIVVTGATVPGAEVMVNETQVPVEPQGRFSTRVAFPDEAQRYPVEVVARLEGKQMRQSLSVEYRPVQIPLVLEIMSPTEGQAVSARLLRVAGKTSPGATVTVNGRSIPVPSSGMISAELPLTEEHITGFALEVSAERGDEEKTRTVNVRVDITSPAVNTSVPAIVVQGHGRPATRMGSFPVTASDRTPEDQMTLIVENNGATEEFMLENGGRQDVALDEGRNVYRIRALDRARNSSNVVSGQIYYLPRMPVIDIIEPSTGALVIDDLPPLPRGVPEHSMQVEIEIDDGIGDIPESIKYCRLSSPRGELVLQSKGKYRYGGRVNLERGSNTFAVMAEDLAGNFVTKTFEIVVR